MSRSLKDSLNAAPSDEQVIQALISLALLFLDLRPPISIHDWDKWFQRRFPLDNSQVGYYSLGSIVSKNKYGPVPVKVGKPSLSSSSSQFNDSTYYIWPTSASPLREVFVFVARVDSNPPTPPLTPTPTPTATSQLSHSANTASPTPEDPLAEPHHHSSVEIPTSVKNIPNLPLTEDQKPLSPTASHTTSSDSRSPNMFQSAPSPISSISVKTNLSALANLPSGTQSQNEASPSGSRQAWLFGDDGTEESDLDTEGVETSKESSPRSPTQEVVVDSPGFPEGDESDEDEGYFTFIPKGARRRIAAQDANAKRKSKQRSASGSLSRDTLSANTSSNTNTRQTSGGNEEMSAEELFARYRSFGYSKSKASAKVQAMRPSSAPSLSRPFLPTRPEDGPPPLSAPIGSRPSTIRWYDLEMGKPRPRADWARAPKAKETRSDPESDVEGGGDEQRRDDELKTVTELEDGEEDEDEDEDGVMGERRSVNLRMDGAGKIPPRGSVLQNPSLERDKYLEKQDGGRQKSP